MFRNTLCDKLEDNQISTNQEPGFDKLEILVQLHKQKRLVGVRALPLAAGINVVAIVLGIIFYQK